MPVVGIVAMTMLHGMVILPNKFERKHGKRIIQKTCLFIHYQFFLRINDSRKRLENSTWYFILVFFLKCHENRCRVAMLTLTVSHSTFIGSNRLYNTQVIKKSKDVLIAFYVHKTALMKVKRRSFPRNHIPAIVFPFQRDDIKGLITVKPAFQIKRIILTGYHQYQWRVLSMVYSKSFACIHRACWDTRNVYHEIQYRPGTSDHLPSLPSKAHHCHPTIQIVMLNKESNSYIFWAIPRTNPSFLLCIRRKQNCPECVFRGQPF